jgi:hypothetical protein
MQANGESRGKRYTRIAHNLRYDHLAILLDESGAGTPEEGVGLFLNEQGTAEPVENAELQLEPEDRRSAGLWAWVKRLVGNGSADVSFDQITSGLYQALRAGQGESAWLQEVFDRFAIWADGKGGLWKQDYAISSDGSVAFSGTAVEVTRRVSYEPLTTNRVEDDPVKDKILAALNAAGINIAGLDDTQLLAAYNAVVTKPHQDALVAANSKVAGFEANARAAEQAEVTALATELAVNSSLSVDDYKALGLARLKELQAASKPAAPVVAGNSGGGNADAFGYDLNTLTAH